MFNKNEFKKILGNLSKLENKAKYSKKIINFSQRNFSKKNFRFFNSTKTKEMNQINKNIHKNFSDVTQNNSNDSMNSNNLKIKKIDNIEENSQIGIIPILEIDPYLTSHVNSLAQIIKRDIFQIDDKIENYSSLNFHQILSKIDENSFIYLMRIIDYEGKIKKCDNINKINYVFLENIYGLKKRLIALAILNNLMRKVNKNLNNESNKIGLYEKVMKLAEEIKEKDKKDYLLITKNYEDAMEYYEIFRCYDHQKKFQVKKFGNISLELKGLSFEKENILKAEYSDDEKLGNKTNFDKKTDDKLESLIREIEKNWEAKIYILPQEYIPFLLGKQKIPEIKKAHSDYYESLKETLKSINPINFIFDEYECFSQENLKCLAKYLNKFDISDFLLVNRKNQINTNHIFISSYPIMKNFFSSIDKEISKGNKTNINYLTLFEQTKIKFNVSDLTNITNLIYVNKNEIENENMNIFGDEKFSSQFDNKIYEGNKRNYKLSDFHYLLLRNKNFFNEINHVKRIKVEIEYFSDINLENQNYQFFKLIRDYCKEKDLKEETNFNVGILCKSLYLGNIKKNLEILKVHHQVISNTTILNMIELYHTLRKNNINFLLFDEETIRFTSIKYDAFVMCDAPEDLGIYVKIIDQIKENGILNIFLLKCDFKSKIQFCESLKFNSKANKNKK